MTKTRAQGILEQLELNFNETTVTTTDMPNFNDAVKKLTVDNHLVPGPGPAHISAATYGGHTFTVVDASHPDAPEGCVSSITSDPEGINKLVSGKLLDKTAMQSGTSA